MTLRRLPREAWRAAAERLVGPLQGPSKALRRQAADEFLARAPSVGIDLSHTWVALGAGGAVREMCMPVWAAGRTVMMFLAPPEHREGGAAVASAEREAVIQAATEWAGAPAPGMGAGLAQALLAREEHVAFGAFEACGYAALGELAYLSLDLASWTRGADALRDGIGLADLGDASSGALNETVSRVLARTYEGTLDCPELCGLRAMDDILDAHRAVGRFDPANWFLLRRGAHEIGCALFNRCPETASVELVYMGVVPEERGRGLGERMLCAALDRIARLPEATATCAVDTRNTPAVAMYERLGFHRTGVRCPMIRSLPPA